MKKYTALLLLFASAALLFSSCQDDALEFGTANIQFNMKANGGDLGYATSYDFEGNSTTLQTVQFYVSGIRFVNTDGQEVYMDDYLLIKPDKANYQLGDLIAGKYNKVRFDVGIDPDINHADPSQYVVGSVLGPQSPAMHWSWASGYIFFRVDGVVDSAGTDVTLTLHLGTDAFLRTVELDYAFELGKDENLYTEINFDLDKALEGIDISTDHISHTMDNMPLANAVIANVPDAFAIAD